MLPGRYRMTRAAEFDATVRRGVRAVQPDMVIHARQDSDPNGSEVPGPRIGLVVAKSVGGAVDRHRVARRLRHVAKAMLVEMNPEDRIVIRALPGSRTALSSRLEQQLSAGLLRAHQLMERRR